MSNYRERYGIPGLDVSNLIRRFYRRLYDSDWEKADDFVKWCSENGYKNGLRLCRIDKSKPHGPENSYFLTPEKSAKGIAEDKRRRKEERKNIVSPFCEGCQKKCRSAAYGCDEYREWFIKNWKQNIRIAKPDAEEKQNTVKVWRYEHPDLVMEGIVFESSCGL